MVDGYGLVKLGEVKMIEQITGNDRINDGAGTANVPVSHLELNDLVGRLLTYVDATYQDTEQRKAHKTLVKQLCREWLNDIYTHHANGNIKLIVNHKGEHHEFTEGWVMAAEPYFGDR